VVSGAYSGILSEQVPHAHLGTEGMARVDYSMPIGAHSGFFNLVKAEGKWLIASWVDHGTVRRRGNQDPLSNLDNST
jgi:hypothetical protein